MPGTMVGGVSAQESLLNLYFTLPCPIGCGVLRAIQGNYFVSKNIEQGGRHRTKVVPIDLAGLRRRKGCEAIRMERNERARVLQTRLRAHSIGLDESSSDHVRQKQSVRRRDDK